ncbi:MAG: Na+/H+ antiporter NhaA [Alphaproteobacteria bacterium]|nr:Na+/H+ antiporter NhaA [Alphaproteobacteria bacterium]
MLVLTSALRRFFAQESAGGVIMLLAAAAALILANTAGYAWYKAFINSDIGLSFAGVQTAQPLKTWVKDVPMVLFFLVVGLELKRELSSGFLSKRSDILMPLACAAAGMALPALFYSGIVAGEPGLAHGWAIPAATDIAFALCVLLLVGRGIPPAAKIFLLAIAIFDDLGAILVVALFYSGGVDMGALALAGLGVLALYALNKADSRMLTPRLLIGVYLWFCFSASGIHTTVAGVVLGMMMPMRCSGDTHHSPLNKCLHFLHPWVSFGVLPLFAFTSAGISFSGLQFSDLLAPLPLGIAAALFFGKQLGILGAAWLLVKTGLAKRPEQTTWIQIYGISIIAGIGFTMSLFIGGLAFTEDMQDKVKLGVIAGSLASAVWGAAVLGIAGRR